MNICENKKNVRNCSCLTMKCEVKLYKAGIVFPVEVIARDYQDARKVALTRNPGAIVVGVTAVFK